MYNCSMYNDTNFSFIIIIIIIIININFFFSFFKFFIVDNYHVPTTVGDRLAND